MHEKKSRFTTIGISSLLVIFAVLCLTVFTLLTISAARADQTLSNNTIKAMTGYYEADFAAEETLALLRTGNMPAGVEEIGNDMFRYAHPISQTLLLVVEVQMDGTDYSILRWQAVSADEWQTDDSIPVWNGEMKEENR